MEKTSPRKEIEELTRELVGIPSHEDETEVGDYIQEWIESETDSEVERDSKGNVIARKSVNGDQSLGFVGHHDVVPPGPSQLKGESGRYVVEKKDDRLHGRGTADMKGAVACMMMAFRDAEPDSELVLTSFVGEEQGGIGAKHAIDQGLELDYAIVGEGSTGYSSEEVTDVAVAHKGRHEVRVEAEGVAAHASEVEKGVNAIYRASEAIDAVRDLEPPETEVYSQNMKGSVVVTEIDGGSARNVIPSECGFTVDERTVPQNQESSYGVSLEKLEDIEGVSFEVTQDLPPMVCDDEDFSNLVLENARKVQEGDSKFVTKPHATDAGHLSRSGTDCVVCGPAEPGEAHTDDESVSLDVLERCYRIYRRVAEEL